MHRMIAVAFLLISPLLQACTEEESPVFGVQPSPPRVALVIEGPRVVVAPGSYEWRAIVDEALGAVSYEWHVTGSDLAGARIAPHAGTLTIALDDTFVGAFDISLTVHARDGTVIARDVLSICPAAPAMDWCVPYPLVEPQTARQREWARRMER